MEYEGYCMVFSVLLQETYIDSPRLFFLGGGDCAGTYQTRRLLFCFVLCVMALLTRAIHQRVTDACLIFSGLLFLIVLNHSSRVIFFVYEYCSFLFFLNQQPRTGPCAGTYKRMLTIPVIFWFMRC